MDITFRPITPHSAKLRKLVPMGDVLKTCRAAAKLALQGKSWSTEERADCAAHLTELVISRASVGERKHGRPADVLAYIGRAMDDANLSEHVRREANAGDYIPARYCGMDFLTKRAGNWRAAREASRKRDELDFSPAPEQDTLDEKRATPWGARRAALDVLQNAGLMDARVPAPDKRSTSLHAPLWTLAYTCARANVGLESDEIARELELDPATHRKHLERALKPLRYGTVDMWADALALDGGLSYGVHSAKLDGERVRLRDALDIEQHAPVTSRKLPASERRMTKHSTWARPYVSRIPGGERKMIDPLTTPTRARYEKATKMRRARAEARDASELRTARLAAGLPAEVR